MARKTVAEKKVEEAEKLRELSAAMTGLVDPRLDRCRKHGLQDIVILTLCAVISGAEGWIAVEHYGRMKEKWLRSFLPLPHGIPSHDTIGRVFSALCPDALQSCLSALLEGLQLCREEEGGSAAEKAGVIAIDGKCLRRSMDRAKGRSPLHMLSAFSTESQVVLGQHAVDSKSNEIKALPWLLNKLDVCGRTVTIDAMGCQKAVVAQVCEQGGDIVVALKDNQATLHDTVKQRFEDARAMRNVATAAVQPLVGYQCHTMGPEKGHGRIESRCVEVLDAQGGWLHEHHPGWGTIKSVICVTRTCEQKGTTTHQTRHFISSHLPDNPAMLGAAVRAHWAIENKLHWSLDTAFREDDCRVRTDHAPENFSLLRKTALALLKADTSVKVGIKNRRLCAAWDPDYMLHIIGVRPRA